MSVAAALETGSGTARASRLALGGPGTSRGAADAERVLLGGPATESVFREADVAVPGVRCGARPRGHRMAVAM